MRTPWLKFFAADWLGEPTLRVCSLAARGLWIDVLMLMHQSPRRGHLLSAAGAPFAPAQLARLVGVGVEELARLLDELRGAGVFGETGGVLFSRRMVREEGKAEKCAAAGKRGGGNPALARPAVVAPGASAPGVTFGPPFKGEDEGSPKGGCGAPLGAPSEPTGGDGSGAAPAPGPHGDGGAAGAGDPGATAVTFKGPPKGGRKGRSKGGCEPPLTQKPEARGITSPSEKCGPAGTAVAGADGPTGAGPGKAGQAANPNHAPAVRAFCDAWAAKYGAKYPFARGKDAALVADVLAAVGNDLGRFGALVGRYLADPWPFAADDRHDLGTLRLKLPRWLVPAAPSSPPGAQFRAPVEFDGAFPPGAAS